MLVNCPLIEAAEALETKALALRQLCAKSFRTNGDESLVDAYNSLLAVLPAGCYFKIQCEVTSFEGKPRVDYAVYLPTTLEQGGWYRGGTVSDALRSALSVLSTPSADPVQVADIALAGG
jgi:hypothetical protein